MKEIRILFRKEMTEIVIFESDKLNILYKSNALDYIQKQQRKITQLRMKEDIEISTMKKLTCDERVDEVCKELEKSAECFEDYIDNLRRVNEMLLKGITLTQIIKVLHLDRRDNFMPTYEFLRLSDIKDVRFINQLPKFDKDEIKDVIYNDPATIVFWEDGTKTVVKCQKDKGDTYNPELGLAMCIIKKMCDNKGNFNDVFNKWLPKDSE